MYVVNLLIEGQSVDLYSLKIFSPTGLLCLGLSI